MRIEPASRLRLIAGLLMLLNASQASSQAGRILFVDQDAHAVSQSNAGAVNNLDPAAPSDSWPDVELAADISAPELEFLERIVVSPVDGRYFFTDRRADSSTPSRVYASSCGTGVTSLLLEDPSLPGPFSLATIPDGRLILTDRHADPSSLGLDSAGEGGHGGVFWLDPATGDTLLLSDGRDHPNYPAAPRGVTVFEDPTAAVHDPTTDLLYVADLSADPLGEGYFGAVFSIDLTDGSVELVASDWDFLALVAIAVRPNGQLLVIDALLNDSIVWEIDPTDNDPEANHLELSSGDQHAYLEDITVDEAGTVFLTDSGEFDQDSSTWLSDPMVAKLDETILDPGANKVLVNNSLGIFTPVGLALNPGCAEPEDGLAVSLTLEGARPDVAAQFDLACRRPAWSICPSYVIAGGSLNLTWQLHASVGSDNSRRLTVYEHSVATQDLRFQRLGEDFLVLAP